jgi:hypothetical protein
MASAFGVLAAWAADAAYMVGNLLDAVACGLLERGES